MLKRMVFLATTMAAMVLAPTAQAVDETRLPVGDGKLSLTGAARGHIYLCNQGPGGGGASSQGPWFNGDGTWDATEKSTVDGSIAWPAATFSERVDGAARTLVGNGLPVGETTGSFPIAGSDDAYAFDRNPNSIGAQSINLSLPSAPEKGAPRCIGGQVGIAKNGVPIFNGFDAGYRDAGAWEVQDTCDGHPQNTGQYHYHSIPSCLNEGESAKQHSKLVGWALDGFPIYGKRGENGEELANADLDVCHGHTHKVKLDGEKVRTYHYHGTSEFPYSVGCFRG
jgi:hypothetical protein